MTYCEDALRWLLVGAVMVGVLPWMVASCLFLLVAVHFARHHYRDCRPYFPRTTVLVPAWNEAAVIGASVDRLMRLDYPRQALRVVIIDDASTDGTPDVARAKAAEYPGRLMSLRRERGGEGKAAALNHALRVVLGDDWTEAILITDADVIYEAGTLRMMTRHLADPRVGAVTAYIKEGSRPGNGMTRFVAYEYIIGQAVARRSQEVLGAMACLAGGLQLHSRSSMEAIGGQIDTSTLAEDTVTTLKVQMTGRRVVFDPHAAVWAEEPGSVDALWKQRLRWARGNLQVTKMFSHIWFRPQHLSKVGGFAFGVFWFSLLLQPLFMITGSIGLVALYALDSAQAFAAFRWLWLANVAAYLFIAVYTLLIDPGTARRTWLAAILFPGVVNAVVMVALLLPAPVYRLATTSLGMMGVRPTPHLAAAALLFVYLWQGGCMAVAYLARVCERAPHGRLASWVFVYLAGYGALSCVVGLDAFIKELRGAEARWDKTEKTGKVVGVG